MSKSDLSFLPLPRDPNPIFVQCCGGQSKDGTDDLMSLSRAGYLMQTPISSMYKNVDHIIHYANLQTPWRLLETATRHEPLSDIFYVCVSMFSCIYKIT